ncbi:hypothetical protein H6G76_03285 [Nostoc sp. FACHB-152]|uniref:hypothetical protein n=1 Tax=unclassified Nostoc TaxID=2593658 RepID=UPI00168288EF|nr:MULTISPECIES: hypothetical protein [unclassified Nostoc]MBD2446194.1 hypothetical protein [Nostoc sp. FACHB-152]MBD2467426.1 hypothetical protein [Nostoc sp. FACHB-145]
MFSRFSRRQIISLISFTVAGAAVTSSFPFMNNFFIRKAQAQEIPDKLYKLRKYKIITKSQFQLWKEGLIDDIFDASTELLIDKKVIKILRHKKSKKYVTPLFFCDFDKPEDIAKAIIDLNLVFPDQEVKTDPTLD